ncbi:MAG: hypothetical protein IJU98_04065 [Synergistaceae bacterium]|nr:hypothetical protein [Synergistaceae bacterium]
MKPSIVSGRALWILSGLLSLTTITGYYFDNALPFEDMTLFDFVMFAFCVGGITPLLKCAIATLYLWVEKIAGKERLATIEQFSASRTWLYAFLVIFICWIPVWLAYYPGLWNYDPWQVWQYINGNYNKQHPLIHTLLIGACYSIGIGESNANNGVILYDFIQMTIMAGIFAYAYVYIARHLSSRVFRMCVLLFFALFPVNSIMAISSTKDVIFSGLILLCLVLSAQWVEAPKSWHMPLLLISAVLTLLFRNNAVYAFCLLTLLTLFFIRKRNGKRIFLFLLCCIVLFKLSDMGLTAALSAKKGPIREVMSIPSQQFGRIYNVVSGDIAARKAIRTFYKTVNYDPVRADSMNLAFRKRNLRATSALQLLKTSFALFIKYPLVSLDSFLYTTRGNWYINDVSNAYVYGSGLKYRQGYLLTDVKSKFKIERSSKIPLLESFLERAFSNNEYQNWPLLPIFFSPAFYFWILLFCSVGFWAAGRRDYLFLTGFLWFNFLTILAAACSIIRFSYPLVVCAPVLICMLIYSMKGDRR